MGTVAEFIDSIPHLSASSKADLQSHVQTEEFGSSLDAEFDKVFKQTLLENLPVKLSALHRTAVRQALEDSGEQSNFKMVFVFSYACCMTTGTKCSSSHCIAHMVRLWQKHHYTKLSFGVFMYCLHVVGPCGLWPCHVRQQSSI